MMATRVLTRILTSFFIANGAVHCALWYFNLPARMPEWFAIGMGAAMIVAGAGCVAALWLRRADA